MRTHLPLWITLAGVTGFMAWAIFVMATSVN